VNKHIQELVELSQIDKKIDSYQPQIDAADKKVAKVQKKLTEAEERLEKISTLISDNEQKIASYEEQLKILNDQLADNVKKSKEISTEKEMKAWAVEEDIAKEKMTFANEEIERLQEVNVKKSKEAEQAGESVDTLKKELAEVTAEADAEVGEIEKSKISLFTEREKTIREIDQKILAFYEKIRVWAGNSAVVPVKKQACYGCHMRLNDKTYADVIKGEEITTCPHCGRILYIERETAEA
jgi:predicted  nucleic acid-binding Zn-ribbon protein